MRVVLGLLSLPSFAFIALWGWLLLGVHQCGCIVAGQ